MWNSSGQVICPTCGRWMIPDEPHICIMVVRCKERGNYTMPDGVVVWADVGDLVHVTADDAARLEVEGKVERYA